MSTIDPPALPVERGKIHEFADAILDDHPFYHDEEAARAAATRNARPVATRQHTGRSHDLQDGRHADLRAFGVVATAGLRTPRSPPSRGPVDSSQPARASGTGAYLEPLGRKVRRVGHRGGAYGADDESHS